MSTQYMVVVKFIVVLFIVSLVIMSNFTFAMVLSNNVWLGDASMRLGSNSNIPYYHVVNGSIYRGDQQIHIFGVSWFGFELPEHVVYGLKYRNWKNILKDVKRLGFNAIRLPFCHESITPGTMPKPGMINYYLNPDLKNLTSLEIMEKIISYANELGLYILLDYHRIGCKRIEPLWYTDNFTEEQYIADWVFLAEKFGKYPNVIGADIKNEPHDEASWGTGDDKTDFRLFAEKVGKAILEVAPHWLIFIEGVQYTHVPWIDSKNPYPCFWGENLMGVKYYPVRLPKDKVVYSPHVYGPSVYMMPYFETPDFPNNLPNIWELHFGYLKELGYAVVIGEWGGRYIGQDKIWQDKFSDWLINKRIFDFFYWCLNPESGDTGGIFYHDWITVNWDKVRLIQKIINASKTSTTLTTTPIYTKTPISQESLSSTTPASREKEHDRLFEFIIIGGLATLVIVVYFVIRLISRMTSKSKRL